MKIVIAPDSFKGSLTAAEAAEAIETGFRAVYPDAEYVKVPMADGGEGTVQSLVDATSGTIITQLVSGPMGDMVAGFFGILGDRQTAVIEMAAASGIHWVRPKERDVFLASSFGTGQLINAALDRGCDKLIVGLGGSATNDGGIGMMKALGAQFFDQDGVQLAADVRALLQLASIDLQYLDPRLDKTEIVVACDVDNPLCGENGAARVFGPQKGATEEDIAVLDQALTRYGDILSANAGRDIASEPGAGAAGGMGAAFIGLIDAVLKPGVDIVIEIVDLANSLVDANLVITGEGRVDNQTIHGKTPTGVAKVAKSCNLPVICITGSVEDGADFTHQLGIDEIYSVTEGDYDLTEVLIEAEHKLTQAAQKIAKSLNL
ncbi:MAG TPA: glycerate kinase [Candidatus Marinimicrobia bacterium]|jgi:glycerate kinase|nr:glycerate kinase [Candidatus Neomarinimicrobiota bacterium]HIM27364.1 glycerate kinase [Candidatus Neomarinimicrobiota bacterium]HIN26577.1 glycerate kinase [Candidatus Neomarinimicrobiota bacterium]